MIKLKSYRPFITKNFIWEFPTHFKLKEVSEFIDEDIPRTTEYISNAAKEIMHNKSVIWLLKNKENNKIVALISFTSVNFIKKSAKLQMILGDLTSTEKKEIADRLFIFVDEQLELNTIHFDRLDETILKKFTLNEYNMNKQELKRS
ncbi:hypothetical protein FC72_GL000597 [Companilactobacillus tucceti DSM 20183]|uniref:N-acetyltransferase domain-containing protein n=1 Tax=Companilactobacillus tucceti DSM 20183 TaxID=1423811 RepID=A0A0R1IYC4_9LACO|nr:hypothetical protein [Companilactobacillus tucceti]KRK64285.1 hypothetical protein FC72_GL000597 [Companilactobacillus tucceti DSM 20183]